jgi:phytoene dehydrogenase-like protein
MRTRRSAIVVGSGPNGFAAGITLARAGYDVTLFEAEATLGGGTRSAALTLPGYVHDVCSAIHPLGVASPFFRSLPLAELGVEWVHAPAPLAHPFDDGTAVLLERSLAATAAALGPDGGAYRDLLTPLVAGCEPLLDGLLAPLLPPRHVVALARFGIHGIRSASGLAKARFHGARARALFAGLAAHAVLPLEAVATASFGLLLGMLGHAWGWPFPRGGSQALADALAKHFTSLGGRIVTGHRVALAAELSEAGLVLFDTAPKELIAIAGDRLPAAYRRRLARYRHGPAAFKVDWALHEPVPWRAAECARAATVHLGGELDEIAASERAAYAGGESERPFVLLAQPSLFDASRAPPGRHTAWAYCHVPNGSAADMTGRIEAQVERFAPGFRERIAARHVTTPADLERHNANYVGGDIVGGSNDIGQLLARPVLRMNPYATPVRGWYLCSASTPPGGGVHGMAGYHAARAALRARGEAP